MVSLDPVTLTSFINLIQITQTTAEFHILLVEKYNDDLTSNKRRNNTLNSVTDKDTGWKITFF